MLTHYMRAWTRVLLSLYLRFLSKERKANLLGNYFSQYLQIHLHAYFSLVAQFKLGLEITNLIPIFYGLDREYPYVYDKEFMEICDICQFQKNSMRLRLFPLSLMEKTKAWFNSLPSTSITLWKLLIQNILTRFFRMPKTIFYMKGNYRFLSGNFFESWE